MDGKKAITIFGSMTPEKAACAAQDSYNRTSEETIAGYSMAMPDALRGEWASKVGSSGFHDADTRTVWEVAQRIQSEGGMPLPAFVLAEAQWPEGYEPPTLYDLNEWASRACFSGDAERHARLLVTAAETRRVLWAIQNVARQAKSPEALTAEPGALTMLAQSALITLPQRRAVDEFDADGLELVEDSGDLFLVDGILQDAGLNVLMSEGGLGKSMAALDLAMKVAIGGSAFGNQVARQGGVVYLGADVDSRTMKRRVRRMRKACGAGGKGELPGFRYVRAPLDFREAGTFQLIQHKMDEVAAQHPAGKCALLIVDALTSYMFNLDENSAGDMGHVINQLRLLSERTGACVLVLHHVNKSAFAEGSNKGRGSTALPNGVDVVLHAQKKGDAVILTQTKNRNGEPMKPLAVKLLDTEDGGLAAVYSEPSAADVGAVMQEVAVDAMVGILRGVPRESMSKQMLFASIEATGSYSARTLQRAWDTLKHVRGMTVGRDGRTASVCYIPPEEEAAP